PSAEAVSHRQQVRRIAINTGFSLWSACKRLAGRLNSVSVFQSVGISAAQAGLCRHLACKLRAGTTMASTFQRGRWQCVD
ncbi:MAG: hypothetical protein ABI919_06950, partial [Ramlibacter sp.]